MSHYSSSKYSGSYYNRGRDTERGRDSERGRDRERDKEKDYSRDRDKDKDYSRDREWKKKDRDRSRDREDRKRSPSREREKDSRYPEYSSRRALDKSSSSVDYVSRNPKSSRFSTSGSRDQSSPPSSDTTFPSTTLIREKDLVARDPGYDGNHYQSYLYNKYDTQGQYTSDYFNTSHDSNKEDEDESDKKDPEADPLFKAVVDTCLNNMKTKGDYDRVRKECFADVDTKAAYQNLNARIKHTVEKFLNLQTFSKELDKVKTREGMRKKILDTPYFSKGIESVVNQILVPRISTLIRPRVEEEVYNYLQIDQEMEDEEEEEAANSPAEPDSNEIGDFEPTSNDKTRMTPEVIGKVDYEMRPDDDDDDEMRNSYAMQNREINDDYEISNDRRRESGMWNDMDKDDDDDEERRRQAALERQLEMRRRNQIEMANRSWIRSPCEFAAQDQNQDQEQDDIPSKTPNGNQDDVNSQSEVSSMSQSEMEMRGGEMSNNSDTRTQNENDNENDSKTENQIEDEDDDDDEPSLMISEGENMNEIMSINNSDEKSDNDIINGDETVDNNVELVISDNETRGETEMPDDNELSAANETSDIDIKSNISELSNLENEMMISGPDEMKATHEPSAIDLEDESDEESPMFEKIGEVSPPRVVELPTSELVQEMSKELLGGYSGEGVEGDVGEESQGSNSNAESLAKKFGDKECKFLESTPLYDYKVSYYKKFSDS